jgi:predicted ATPase/class 3 adenylate cyclase
MDVASAASSRETTLPPSGSSAAVTFLFTDIEGSTQRWESNAPEMSAAVARHDGIMRAAIERHRGSVFKTVGDAFCAAFESAEDAVAAAIEAQRSIAGSDFSAVDGIWVRMGVHTGTVVARDGDFFGPTVNRVARLMSVGHGGQILVSDGVAELVRQGLDEGVELSDLGMHRLKDLAGPIRIFEIRAPFMQHDHPPLRSLDARPNNLPLQLTQLIGRDGDVETILRTLDDARLVTLHGTGGVGKTRLAVQVGADALDRFPDGVWFVDLAPLTDRGRVPDTLAAVIGLRESGSESLVDGIVRFLRPQRAMLILDNCEHVLEGAVGLVDAVLRGCARCAVLATSREALRIPGEHVYRVASLDAPEPSEEIMPSSALRHPAVALFVDRAIAAAPGFTLTDANVRAVIEVCRRLDGIPLALELAAARIRIMTPQQLAGHLDDHFRVLTQGARNALPRQQTMRALIDWSHDLLGDVERTVFRRLAAFSGGWTLEAAGAVCADEPVEQWDVINALTDLAEKSLVAVDPSEARQRYRFLETTRAYAAERLAAAGEAESTARRHALWYADTAAKADAEWSMTHGTAWVETVEADLENFRAAFDWAVKKRHDPVIGAALTGSLLWLFRDAGMAREGLRWYAEALAVLESECADPPPALEARLRLGAAMFGSVIGTGHDERRRLLERSVELYRKADDSEWLAWSLRYLCIFHSSWGDKNLAPALLEEASALSRSTDNVRLRAWCIDGWSFIVEDRAERRKHKEEALALLRSSGDVFGTPNLLLSLGPLLDNDRATLSVIREGVELSRSSRDRVTHAFCLLGAAGLAWDCAEIDESRQHLRSALALGREQGLMAVVTDAIYKAAVIAGSGGDGRVASMCIGYADARVAAAGEHRVSSTEKWRDRAITAARRVLEEDRFTQIAGEGAALSEDEAIALASNV